MRQTLGRSPVRLGLAESATNERVISAGCDELHLISVESRAEAHVLMKRKSPEHESPTYPVVLQVISSQNQGMASE